MMHESTIHSPRSSGGRPTSTDGSLQSTVKRPRAVVWRLGMVAVLVAALCAGPVAAQSDLGDCDGDGFVTIDELITGVNVALEELPLASCVQADANGDGEVTVDELIRAVQRALTGPLHHLAFIVATDFQTGSFGTVGIEEPRDVTPVRPARSINSDAVARPRDGLVYVINRFGADNIQVLDPAQDFVTRLQCSTGAGSNPSDIAFAGTAKAYVALLGAAHVLIVNPAAQPDCSDFVLGTVDLSEYADSDGIPDASQLAIVGDRLYVALQRLTDFAPSGSSAVVVIDTGTDTVVGEIVLAGQNPFGQWKGLPVIDGKLVIATIGEFGVNDGGIERIDLASGTTEGFFITEEDLGGDIVDFVIVSPRLGYAIVSKPDFTNDLVAFDPAGAAITQTLISAGTLSDIELNDRGQLFVADRDFTTPGVRIFRAHDGTELTAAPIDVGLPAFDISFLP